MYNKKLILLITIFMALDLTNLWANESIDHIQSDYCAFKLYETRFIMNENYFIFDDEILTTDTPAYISSEGVPMIPLRETFELYGYENIEWNDEDGSVSVHRQNLQATHRSSNEANYILVDSIITFIDGKDYYVYNDKTIDMIGCSEFKDGTFYIPFKVLKDFGFYIIWYEDAQVAVINEKIELPYWYTEHR